LTSIDRPCPGQRLVSEAARTFSGLTIRCPATTTRGWGLRLQIFVPESEKADILTVLHDHLPDEFAGLPTRFAFTGQDEHTVAVDVHRVDELVSTKLGLDPRIGATPLDWLSLTGQAALEMTAGAVFEDSDDELT